MSYWGIFLFSDFKHVGSICSQLTAQLMVNHYHKHSIRLGEFVQVVVKQYARLSGITARFHFSTSNCIGYLNLMANTADKFEALHCKSTIIGARVRRFAVYMTFHLVWT